MPGETDNYHVGGDGRVDPDGNGETHGPGEMVKDAVDDAGRVAGDAARGAGDVVRGAVDGAGRAIEKAGDVLTGRR